jgi:pilus assembly protein FimV
VVEQRSDFHYSDDDLTTIDGFDSEPVDPSDVDLFDYVGDDSSPISRLKALVVSIDWEITDQVLCDFNEELISLRDIWGGDPIKVVYLQVLEKISKYIYRTQSEAHPDAIRLLPLLFVDLEKIVQSGREMSEDEKKQLLIEDVRRFERLKAQIIERHRGQFAVSHEPVQQVVRETTGDATDHDGVMAINRLKALILGIDWEITEKDLLALRREVLHLESIFANSRPKQLFLQGIGTLSAYIRNKKSNAHADAFSLLHDFFCGLEQVVSERLDFPAEKAVLLSLVSRFNTFKETIASTLSAEAIAKSKQAVLEEEAKEEEEAGPLQPAFADEPDNIHGFHIEKEALSPDVPEAVMADVEKFFIEEDSPPLAKITDAISSHDLGKSAEDLYQSAIADPMAVAPEVALRGINVETEADDDSGEAALPRQGGQLAPALSDEPAFPYTYGEASVVKQAPVADSEIPEEINSRLDNFFSTPLAAPATSVYSAMEETRTAAIPVSSNVALQGVNVDTDADDERDEDAPAGFSAIWCDKSEKEPAPALADVAAPELRLEESEAEVEFAPVAAGGSAFLLDDDDDDDEAEAFENGESGEIMPALSGFDDADLPERSEFAEEDDAVTLENEKILAFFQDESPDAGEETTLPVEIEKPETLVVDELEVFEAPVSDKNTEPELVLTDEPELMFIDDFSADKSEHPPAFAFANTEFSDNSLPVSGDISLRECVNALADEINDDILDQSYRQVRRRRAELADHPLAEIYLQLIAAIMQHIDQRRADASEEALPLLRQTLVHLEESQQNGRAENTQRLLLDDTQAVLSWQQSLLEERRPVVRSWL